MITGGIRINYNVVGGDPVSNNDVAAQIFQDGNGESEQFQTDRLPEAKLSIVPRLGFVYNSSVKGLIIRGGLGVFEGLPSMVRIGDQFINNGVLQGEIKAKNNQANQYPFSSDPEAYIPENPQNNSTYDVNFVVVTGHLDRTSRSGCLARVTGLRPSLARSFDHPLLHTGTGI